jgi:hypothetical protein
MADSFSSAAEIVVTLLSKLGLDPKTSLLRDEPATKAWGLKRGSAQVLLTLTKSEKHAWLRIAAPVVNVPSDGDAPLKLKFFSRLLDLNAKAMRNAAFGVMGELVVIVSERPVEGLDLQEAEQMLNHVSALADHYDDLLSREHGLIPVGKI